MPVKLLILGVSLAGVLGQLCLKRGMVPLGGLANLANLPKFILGAAMSPWMYAAVAFQAGGYILWMMLISRVKLGVATASAGAGFYILVALSAWGVFGETLTLYQWVGLCLITLGVTLVGLGPT